eukprot:1565439-Lingulodinium_polyedra.AAC.1
MFHTTDATIEERTDDTTTDGDGQSGDIHSSKPCCVNGEWSTSSYVRGNVPTHGGPIQPGRRRDVDSSDTFAGFNAPPRNPELAAPSPTGPSRSAEQRAPDLDDDDDLLRYNNVLLATPITC